MARQAAGAYIPSKPQLRARQRGRPQPSGQTTNPLRQMWQEYGNLQLRASLMGNSVVPPQQVPSWWRCPLAHGGQQAAAGQHAFNSKGRDTQAHATPTTTIIGEQQQTALVSSDKTANIDRQQRQPTNNKQLQQQAGGGGVEKNSCYRATTLFSTGKARDPRPCEIFFLTHLPKISCKRSHFKVDVWFIIENL